MFTLVLRIILIVAAVGLFVFLMVSVRKSKLSIEDATFWVGFSFLILLMSIFPEIPSWLSTVIGFMSPVNFVFLFFIFVLIVRDFLSNRRISQLENRVKELTQQIAVDRLDHFIRRSHDHEKDEERK